MSYSTDEAQVVAAGFLAALQSNALYAPPSAACPPDRPLDMDGAVAVQRAFVELRSAVDRIAGYKSAANAAPLQEALGLTAPITGVLFASGARAAGSILAHTAYRTLLIETEIGFRAARRIGARVLSLAELRNATSTCIPMIELADPGFGRTRFTGLDLLAANAASAGFICGTAQSAARVDANEVRVRLCRDDTTLHEAQGRDLMGDQWQALLWLVNTVVELGYVIEPGQLLMTGALGGAHPALPGEYVAEFGVLGEVRFSVASQQ